ncbi:MAG: hypothetical protein Q9220_000290 [cf. Caloplaca sp. 1 TL-2023]
MAGIGVGVQEMGNKGAVGMRIGYAVSEDETVELTFVAAHLAPMEDAISRRNEDWMNIVKGLVFTSLGGKDARHTSEPQGNREESQPLVAADPDEHNNSPQGLYTATSHLIFAGDLNYRTSSTKPQLSDHLVFPQPTKDNTGPRHYSHLLQKDQLGQERAAGRTLHGLSEAPIDFPPTYKYSNKAQVLAEIDDGTTTQWDWAQHRWPSWCDRILFLDNPPWMRSVTPTVKMEVQQYTALPLMPTSDHRPVLLALKIPLVPIPRPNDGEYEGDVRLHPPFEVDPAWKERRKAARRKEIVVGLVAYLILTWEGLGILLALIVGVLGGWAIISVMLA